MRTRVSALGVAFVTSGAIALPSVANAIEIDFQVPVRARNLADITSHVVVTCGSFNGSAFVNSQTTVVALGDTVPKGYSGIVNVVVSWPGETVPTGRYRCNLAIRAPSHVVGAVSSSTVRIGEKNMGSLPGRPGTVVSQDRQVAVIEGNFSELRTQALGDKVQGNKRLPNVPAAK